MAGKLTFGGGVRLKRRADAIDVTLHRLPSPREIDVPLLQWQGSAAAPTVSVGSLVLRGQKIGESGDADGCPVYSGVSGKVISVEPLLLDDGKTAFSVRIQNDGRDQAVAASPFRGSIHQTASKELIARIRDLGVVDGGSPAVPLHTKLQNARGNAKTLIVNCMESDPLLRPQRAILSALTEEVLSGAKIMMAAAEIGQAILAIGESETALVKKIEAAAGQSDLIEVKMLREKYPQSEERLLLCAISGRELPAGHIPEELGYTVVCPETCAALFQAMRTGLPQTEKTVALGGEALSAPQTLRVTVGTSLPALLAQYHAPRGAECLRVEEGALCGEIIPSDSSETVVTARSSGFLFLSDRRLSAGEDPISAFFNRLTHTEAQPSCIRCGRCVIACPMQLMPSVLAEAAREGDISSCRAYHMESCIACGSCTYVCPAHIPVAEQIRSLSGFRKRS